jgi:hypothetical protein
MAKTNISLTNVNKPARKWYRKAKKGYRSAIKDRLVMAVFQVFNLTDKQMANVGIIIAFLPTLLEVFSGTTRKR